MRESEPEKELDAKATFRREYGNVRRGGEEMRKTVRTKITEQAKAMARRERK